MRTSRNIPLCPVALSFDQKYWTHLSGTSSSNLFGELIRILLPQKVNEIIETIEAGAVARVTGTGFSVYLCADRRDLPVHEHVSSLKGFMSPKEHK